MCGEEIIGLFAEEVGLGEVRPNAAGAYHFDIDGMTVAFRETADASGLLVYGEVGALPPEGDELFCRVMLQSMFAEGELSGAAFSIHPETDRVFLQRLMPLEGLDLPRFKALLEAFVNELEKWRGILSDYSPATERIDAAMKQDARAAREFEHSGFLRV